MRIISQCTVKKLILIQKHTLNTTVVGVSTESFHKNANRKFLDTIESAPESDSFAGHVEY